MAGQQLTCGITRFTTTITIVTSQPPGKNWWLAALQKGVDGTLPPAAMGTCMLNETPGYFLYDLPIHKDFLENIVRAIVSKSPTWKLAEYIICLNRNKNGEGAYKNKLFRDMETAFAVPMFSSKFYLSRTRARISTFDRILRPQQIIKRFANPDLMSPPVTLVVT